ncbi:hypothetical protein CN433_31870, partial [Bacillus cereus]
MQYCIRKYIVIIVSAYYNKVIKIYYILIRKRGENNMEIA